MIAGRRRLVKTQPAGVGISGVVLLVRYRCQAGLIRGSVPAGEELPAHVRECAGTMGIHRLPEIKLSKQVPTPMLLGLLRSVVLLPAGIAESCSPSDFSAMLMHEMAHVKRRDLAGLWLHQLAQALFFFHPAAWLAGSRLKREREIACDELVLATSCITPSDYASGYVSALRLANGVSRSVTALGMAEPYSMEKKRLEMILRNAIPRMSAAWICGLLVLIAVGLPTFAGTGAKSPAKVVLPDSGPALLDALVAASERAAGAITSGKGIVVVTSVRQTEMGVRIKLKSAFGLDRNERSIWSEIRTG
jgi:beta-lactamase regulating signal transducer with metallopeptidase domain